MEPRPAHQHQPCRYSHPPHHRPWPRALPNQTTIERLAYCFDKPLDILFKIVLVDLDRLAAREWLQQLRQLASPGHVRPIDENRNDMNLVGKRRGDLDCNEVVRMVE